MRTCWVGCWSGAWRTPLEGRVYQEDAVSYVFTGFVGICALNQALFEDVIVKLVTFHFQTSETVMHLEVVPLCLVAATPRHITVIA